ncbi:NUDIX hydrolase [Actinophytocola sp.]|uniref:NUDIX hydrolase n=1 Tax=Actinophytocola sp. TaxID=1872138 RepID=UPI002D2B492E|nr:NUDIX domain-containing protein [Actinophytocola sp.]HYQ67873.1 NUDIX domain-containing protein [Actinophytocola sp.]
MTSDPAVVSLTVDLVIFTVRGDELRVLLVERGNEPYRGRLALPGGYLRGRETLDQAALRELREETNLDGSRLHLEQLRTYSDPDRDPRGRVVTSAYLALGADLPAPVAGTDAREAYWVPVCEALGEGTLAFDHGAILRDGLERARSKLEYTSIATVFCAEPFTISELRRVYEVIWGISLDPSNFRRKLTRAEGLLESTGDFRMAATGRPAALYRRGPAALLMPPFLRALDAA